MSSHKSRRSVTADLIRSQDPEGGNDLLRCVSVGRLSRHEVDEGLEGDGALSVGIHQGHDACKFSFALRQGCKETGTLAGHNPQQCHSPSFHSWHANSSWFEHSNTPFISLQSLEQIPHRSNLSLLPSNDVTSCCNVKPEAPKCPNSFLSLSL